MFINVKLVAKTMGIEEFEKRFIQENQGFKDNCTGKSHFCIHDLGFEINRNDCLEIRNCKACFNEATDYLKLRSKNRKAMAKHDQSTK